MRVKFGNSIKDVPIVEVTPENYIVPKGEEDTFHCKIEQTQFNPRNGKRLSRPRIQKFEAKMYPSVARNLRQQGWDIEVLYDPTEFIAEREAKRAQLRDLTFQQRKEQEEKRKAAERKALKDEILAELQAAGMLKAPAKNGKKGKNQEEPKDGGSTEE